MACVLARTERLVDSEGILACRMCNRECAWHVSLVCPSCLEAHRRDRARELRAERRMDDEDYRWRGMTRNMIEDTRLSEELALTLIENAGQLPSATPERKAFLQKAFNDRFGVQKKQKPRPERDRWADGGGDR